MGPPSPVTSSKELGGPPSGGDRGGRHAPPGFFLAARRPRGRLRRDERQLRLIRGPLRGPGDLEVFQFAGQLAPRPGLGLGRGRGLEDSGTGTRRARAGSGVHIIYFVDGHLVYSKWAAPAGAGVVSIGGCMRPVKRSGVNKGASAAKFRRGVSRTKEINLQPSPMRGGWRL